jgi:hypothetical protein
VLADKNLLPDGWELMGYFRTAFDEYLQLLEASKREDSDPLPQKKGR